MKSILFITAVQPLHSNAVKHSPFNLIRSYFQLIASMSALAIWVGTLMPLPLVAQQDRSLAYEAAQVNRTLLAAVNNSIPSSDKEEKNLRIFKAAKTSKGIQLIWAAEQQHADARYEVERSVSGNSYIRIGSLGAGGKNMYSYIDKYVFQPAYYYRIRIVRKNNPAVYSRSLRVNIAAVPGAKPASDKAKAIAENSNTKRAASYVVPIIQLNSKSQPVLKPGTAGSIRFRDRIDLLAPAHSEKQLIVEISGMKGRIILNRNLTAEKGNGHYIIDQLERLPAGSYQIRIRYAGRQMVYQAIK
jgi:hypothetical protein